MILAMLCQVRLAALLVRVTEKTELALFLSKAKDLRQSENTISCTDGDYHNNPQRYLRTSNSTC